MSAPAPTLRHEDVSVGDALPEVRVPITTTVVDAVRGANGLGDPVSGSVELRLPGAPA